MSYANEFYFADSSGDVTHRLKLTADAGGLKLFVESKADCEASLTPPGGWSQPGGSVYSMKFLGGYAAIETVSFITMPPTPSVSWDTRAMTSPAVESGLSVVPAIGTPLYLLDANSDVTHVVTVMKDGSDYYAWVKGPSGMPTPSTTPPSSGGAPGGTVQSIGIQSTDPATENNAPPPSPAPSGHSIETLIYSNVASLLDLSGLPMW